MTHTITSLLQMQALARAIAPLAQTGDVITLTGDLGAGKTTFAQFFIRHLAGEETEVLSPTFNLVHPYETDALTLYHFDLYRLENGREVWELGLEDALDNGVSLIEWPQIIDDILPLDRLLVDIKSLGDVREVTLEGRGTWVDRIRDIKL